MSGFLEILKEHVKTPFLAAFAYGSAVFKQRKMEKYKKMIDYLVIVKDDQLSQWHRENYKNNPNDYPLIGKFVLDNSKLFNESVYYVPDVQTSRDGGNQIKYGVVGWDVLKRDLYTWNSLFLAGRLQKPTLRCDYSCDEFSSNIIDKCMEFNYISALKVALLQLSNRSHFDFNHVLHKIVALSYTNDPRLLLAESPNKISNIVQGQGRELEEIYWEKYEMMRRDGYIQGLNDPLVKLNLLNDLPFNLKYELINNHNNYNNKNDLWKLSLSNDSSRLITDAIGRIVRRSAWKQMSLGIVSTPLGKAFKYAITKIGKRIL